jgi:hypothetical protein
MPIFTRKSLVQGIIAVVVVVLIFFLYKKYKNKSTYIMPPTSTSDTVSTRQIAYSSNLSNCEVTYIDSVNSNGGTVSTAITDALNECISSNVTAYYNARCPFLPGSDGTAPALSGTTYNSVSAPKGVLNGTSNVAFSAYKTDIDAINATYTPLIAAAGQTQSVVIIQAARKADFTGATRKYFATLCPDLYTTSTDSTSQALYRGWTKDGTASSAYGWDSSKVTLVNIWEWAKYAGVAPTISGTTYTAPASPLINATTTKLECSISRFNTTVPGTSPAVKYWQFAADNGPGTVRAGTTFPWHGTPSTSICSAGNGTYITGATNAAPLP